MQSLQDNNIAQFIRSVRIRLLMRDCFQSAAFISVIFLSSVLFAPLFQRILKEQFQLSLKIVLLLLLLILVLRVIILVRSNSKQSKFYQSLKRFFPPGLTDDIYSAEEFISTMKAQTEPLFAPELAYAHINIVEKKIKGMKKNDIPFLSPESRTLINFACILIISIIFLDAFSGAYKNTLSVLFRSIPSGSTGIVNSIDINYIYPAYTGLPPAGLKNTDGNIRALKGTTAELKVFLRVESDKCEIVLGDGERFPLQSVQNLFHGSIIVETAGTYYIGCMQGKKFLKDSTLKSIAVDEDEYPTIDAYLTGRQEVISLHDNIWFSYSARDDFGLQRISFSCESSSGERYNTSVKELSLISETINGEHLWNTAEMNLKKGDEIMCYLSAFDNDTISGPKEGRSQIFHFKVGALDTRERLMEDIGALFEGFVNVLANILEKEDKSINSKFIADLNREMLDLKTKSTDILKSFADIQGKGTEVLNKTIADVDAILIELKGMQSKTRRNARKTMESITNKLEGSVLSLYTLIKLGRYELLMNTAEDILLSQQSILEKFKDGDVEGIYKKIMEMEKMLAEMFSGLASGARNFSEEFINMDALKKMGSKSLFNKINELKSLLQQGKTEEARKLYEEFMSEYAKMVASMQEFLSKSTLKEFSEFMKKLDELQSEVKKLMSREGKITSALKDSESRMGRDIHKWLKEELEKVNELINKIDLMQKRTDSFNLQNLREARRRAELIKISLSALHLFDALTEAKATLEPLEKVQFLPNFTKDEKAKSELNSSIALNREIINDIEKVLQNLSAGLDEKSKQKLQSLAKEQNEIEKRTRELSSEFEKSQSGNELMKTPVPDMLSGAAGFMKGAKNRMEDADPSGGFQNASEAIKQLGKIDDYIEDMKSGGGMPMPILFGHRGYGSGYGSNIGRVELPGEQESAYQKEIKEELLRAIRGGLPEKLEEENRKYIKELMK